MSLRIDDSTTIEDWHDYGPENIGTRELFKVTMSMLHRVDRMEIALGNLINIVLLEMSGGEDSPGQDVIQRTCEALAEFNEQLAEQVTLQRQIRDTIEFMEQPE